MRWWYLPVPGCLLIAACSTTAASPEPVAPVDGSVDNSVDAAPLPDGGDATLDVATPEAGPADDLASMLEPIRADGGLPGLGAAVFQGSDLIALGATGFRKQGDPTKVTAQDQWHLGSDTKAMTATLVGLYVDRGDLKFEDTLAQLFAGETLDPGYASVTLEQMLQHRGGAPGEMPPDIWSQMWADGAAPGARTKAVLAVLSRPPEQAPGTYVYSNAGYMIAGVVLERVSTTPWETIIAEKLFEPLKMASCGFGAPGTPGQVDQPWGHDVNGGQLVPIEPGPDADNPPSMGPAGTVHCSLADWGTFLSMHLAGARGETTMLTSATMQRLHTPPAGGDYAAGWIVADRSWAGGTALTHTGSNLLWMATTWIAPNKNVAMAVVTNRGDDPAFTAVDSVFGPLIQKYIADSD